MFHLLTNSRLFTIPALSIVLFQTPSWGQQPGAGGGGGASVPASSPGSPGGNVPTAPGGNTRGTIGNFPNRFPTNPQTPREMERPYFFSGRVMFDDGTPPNTDIRIERMCGANARLEAHTDSKGRFYFQLGQNMGVDVDASTSGLPSSVYGRNTTGGSYGDGDFSGMPGGMGGNSTAALWNCELRASYPGYRSDTVRLAGRQPLDRPDVGTIVLHHLGNVQGSTISLTTALAPKNARKAYEKGLKLAQKAKFEEAQQRLREATDLYPKYAIAWYALGQVQQHENRNDEARKSFEAAIAADSRYVSPYDQLARLAAQQSNWEDAAKFSKQAVSLNPVEFPSSFWYNAIANYQLKKANDAEKSVRELLKLDTRHNYPQAETLIGQLLLQKGNYREAETHLKNYLTLMPKAENADAIKQILNKIGGANALTKAATPPPPQP